MKPYPAIAIIEKALSSHKISTRFLPYFAIREYATLLYSTRTLGKYVLPGSKPVMSSLWTMRGNNSNHSKSRLPSSVFATLFTQFGSGWKTLGKL